MSGAKTARRDFGGARWNSDRDRKILHALGRAVLLTVAQVRLVGQFGSREAAARRMRKLAKLGYVRIWKSKDKTECARYGLTKAGKERLILEGEGVVPERLHVAKGVDRRDLEHLRRLADVRIAVGLAADHRRDLALIDYLGEADLRQVVEESGKRLLPDAFLILENTVPVIVGQGQPELAHPDRSIVSNGICELGVWIEADRGTESVRRFIEQKLAPLANHIACGSPVLGASRWLVVVLAETERRAEAIARAAAGALVGAGIWLATAAAFVADPFGPVLQPTAGGDQAEPQSLPHLLFQRGVPAAGTGAGGNCRADAER